MKSKAISHPLRYLRFLVVPFLLVILAIVLSQRALAESPAKFKFEFREKQVWPQSSLILVGPWTQKGVPSQNTINTF